MATTLELNPPTIILPRDELVLLAAEDSDLYTRHFFPNTFRMASPPKHRELWSVLDDPRHRYVVTDMFRGSGKTTHLRAFTSKRIAYGLSRTILYIGASEADAGRSVQWLRAAVDRNFHWASTYGLKPGRKWGEFELEIINEAAGHTINILGLGISGSTRGVNFDDYRPDLIILDDTINDENAATKEQREKHRDLILGAVKESLAPATEEPNAKLVFSNTPQHEEDAHQQAKKDPQFKAVFFGCWTDETMDLPLEEQQSSWPERYPTETLRAEKRAAIARNMLSTFIREMECRLITAETAAFKREWLTLLPRGIIHPPQLCVLGIDPVQPPTDKQVEKDLQTKDWEAHVVVGLHKGRYTILDVEKNRGHQPDWSVKNAISMGRQYRIARMAVETLGYQRTLKWHLEQEMKRIGIHFVVVAVDDKRKKFARIMAAIQPLASQGLLDVPEHLEDFLEQYLRYPKIAHDDVLDAAAIAITNLVNPFLELHADEWSELPRDYMSPLYGEMIDVEKAP